VAKVDEWNAEKSWMGVFWLKHKALIVTVSCRDARYIALCYPKHTTFDIEPGRGTWGRCLHSMLVPFRSFHTVGLP
jgi:hypothetical protein